jgi:5-methylthioadenosine/S-adenosylhomocysteine deaminase
VASAERSKTGGDPSGESALQSAVSTTVAPVTVRFVADAVVPCTGDGDVLRPGAVEVAGDTVVRVGTPARLRADEPGDVREVRVDGALLPGFVNTHCHSPMTLFRGTGENIPLQRWLNDVLWPREAHLEPEDVYWGMTLAAAELLAFGVTTSCEMYFHEDANADAVIDAGSRAVLTPGVLQLPGSEEDGDWWTASLDRFADFHDRRHGEAGRIEVGFAAHAAYTVPLPGLVDTAAVARGRDALFHLHLAETADEADGFVAEHGGSVPQVLADAGVFDGRVLAAHSIWLSTEDIACYVAHDVAVAHCPQSNAKLASGIAPVTDLLAAGVRVGLGTDGPASNNDLDLWEEMRLAALLARLRQGDAGALPAAVALDLATRGAGVAIGRPDLGVLAPGAKADMMAVCLDDPAFVPLLDDAMLVEHLVWSASSRLVTDVWVAGVRVVSDGVVTTVDLDRARAEVGSRAARLAAAGD